MPKKATVSGQNESKQNIKDGNEIQTTEVNRFWEDHLCLESLGTID